MSELLGGTAFYQILFTIDACLYKFFSLLYGLYVDLANIIILQGDTYDLIVNRIMVIVGVIALFIISYSLLQNIINPDDKKSENGFAIVKKLIIAFVVVIMMPTVFTFLYGLQNAVLSGNVLTNLINGDSYSEEYTVYYSSDVETSSGSIETHYICASCTSDDIQDCYDNGYTKKASSISDPSVSGVCNGADVAYEIHNIETANITQDTAGNQLAITIMEGFISADDDFKVSISEYMLESTIGGGVIGAVTCAVVTAGSYAFAAGTAILTVGTSILAASAAAAGICAIVGAYVGLGTSGYISLFSSNPTWGQFKIDAIYYGDFINLIPFSSEVGDGVEYLVIVSTIAACLLIWLLFNFILDMAVRIVKLAFYQVIVPLPAFLSVLPGNSDLLKNYFKTVMTVYFEVFIRVVCLALIGFLANLLYELEDLDLFLKAIIMFGVITLLKEFPKMFSEVTGIKSEGMKLGIREKLGNGGVFAAGALGRAGVTGLVRGTVDSEGNILKGMYKSAKSMYGAGKSGALGAKDWSSMNDTAKKGVSLVEAKEAKNLDKKIRYKAKGVNGVQGRFEDFTEAAGIWSGLKRSEEQIKREQDARAEVDRAEKEKKDLVTDLINKNKFTIAEEHEMLAGIDPTYAAAFDSIRGMKSYAADIRNKGYQDGRAYKEVKGFAMRNGKLYNGNTEVDDNNFHEYLSAIAEVEGHVAGKAPEQGLKIVKDSKLRRDNETDAQYDERQKSLGVALDKVITIESKEKASIQANHKAHGITFDDIPNVGTGARITLDQVDENDNPVVIDSTFKGIADNSEVRSARDQDLLNKMELKNKFNANTQANNNK